MISLRDVTLRRGVKCLFEHASATFHRGQKIGVTGANGAGKSSLFSLIKGELHADSGEVELQPGLVVAEVAQELPAGNTAAISPSPTHADIASRISTHREAVTREYHNLSESGLIEQRRGKLVIHDIARLETMVREVMGE